MYLRWLAVLEVWAAIGMMLTFLWPFGAIIHSNIEAVVLGWIPVPIMRLWNLWAAIQALWDSTH